MVIALVEHVPSSVITAMHGAWAPHYSAISAISSDELLANQLMKNPQERFDANSFIQFLNEQLLPAMNPFNGENPRSVIVMGKSN